MNTATHGVREPLGALQIIIPATFKSDMNDSTPTPSRLLRLYAALAQWIFWVVLAVSLLLLAGWGALHGWIVPRIGEFRPQLERQASKALGVPVHIGDISARSEGVVPSFTLHDVSVSGPDGREAVHLSRVDATLSPTSLWRRGFEQITIHQPRLDVRRSAEGRIFVAGLDLSQDDAGGGGQAADWLFSQKEIAVRGGEIMWTDALRSAPLLALHDVDVVLRNSPRRHAVRLDATPPDDWGARFSVVGQFRQPLLVRRSGLWQEWAGQVYADFPRVDVSQLRRHFRPGDLGTELAQGKGALRWWADVRGGALDGAVADVSLTDVNATLGRGLPPLALQSVQGRFTGRRLASGFSFASKGLQFQTADGLQWPGGNVAVTYTGREGQIPAHGELHADQLDLAALRHIANRLPLGDATHAALKAYQPSGRVEVLDASWQGLLEMPEKYQARGRVAGLAIASQAAAGAHAVGIPGIRGANVDFDLNQLGGRAAVDIQRGAFDLPGVFDDPLLPFDEFVADTRWQVDGDRIALQMENVKFANADAQGKMRLGWHTSDPAQSGAQSRFPGVLDLSGTLSRGQGTRVYRYLPRVLGADVNAYVRDAVQAGAITGAEFRVKGDLHDLPFTDPKQGDFHIAAQVKNAVYAYVPPRLQPAGALPWPALTQLSGDLIFDRASMRIKAANARFAGMPDTRILQADAVIDDLNHAVVKVSADVRGPLTEALGLVAGSPLAEMSSHALDVATATGAADYRIKLGLPIHAIDNSTVEGRVTLADNDIRLRPDTPLFARAKGVVGFTEKGFSLNAVQARLLGGDVRLDGGLQAPPGTAERSGAALPPTLLVRAQGVLSADGLRQARELGVVSRLAEHASGSTPYSAVLGMRRGVPELQLSSTLQGLALDLPAPLRKPAETLLPLQFDNTLTPESLASTGPAPAPLLDRVRARLGTLVSVDYLRDVSGASARVQRGAITVGDTEPATLPTTGVTAQVQLPALDIDAWHSVLGQAAEPSPQVSTTSVDSSVYLPTSMALRVPELRAAGRTLHDVVLGATRSGSTWRANAHARELDGYVEYRQESQSAGGGVFARLARLRIPASATPDVESMLEGTQPTTMPALDVVVDDLELGGHKLGRVEVDAVNRAGSGGAREWMLNKLSIRVPEAEMNATGKWAVHSAPGARSEAASRTALDFTLDIADSGELLKRFGMPDVVRRGKGRMQGTLGWNGSPLALDYPSMAGQLNVNIASGQFLKADPGLAKLLGVLSLQALPRRLALDFRDVFSEGFAFDFVRGDVTMAKGIASTNNMQMRGVNAAVLMDGSANVDDETQNLRVVVVPELNTGTATLVAAVINPAIGLGTFLAQAFLRGPLIEAATREFQVDGSWAEPRITRITGRDRSGAAKVGVNP